MNNDVIPHLKSTASTLRKYAWLILRIVFLLLIYWWLLKGIALDEFSKYFTVNLLSILVVSILLVILQAAFCAYRWRKIALVMAPNIPSFSAVFWVYQEGLFFNQFLPSTIGGDFLRIIRWRSAGVSSLVATSSVFIDRLSGINGTAATIIIGFPFLVHDSDNVEITLFAAFLAIAVFFSTFLGFMLLAWPHLFYLFRKFDRLWRLLESLRTNLAFDRVFIEALALSIVGVIIGGLAAYCLAVSLGINMHFLTFVAVFSVSTLISMIPISLAGWGIREASIVAMLAPLGVATEQAFILGFMISVLLALSSMLGGLAILRGWTNTERSRI